MLAGFIFTFRASEISHFSSTFFHAVWTWFPEFPALNVCPSLLWLWVFLFVLHVYVGSEPLLTVFPSIFIFVFDILVTEWRKGIVTDILVKRPLEAQFISWISVPSSFCPSSSVVPLLQHRRFSVGFHQCSKASTWFRRQGWWPWWTWQLFIDGSLSLRTIQKHDALWSSLYSSSLWITGLTGGMKHPQEDVDTPLLCHLSSINKCSSLFLEASGFP